MSVFLKQPFEAYPIAFEFVGVLPDGASLASGVLSAVNMSTGLDATATVLESPTATIAGTQAIAFVKAGGHGTDYRLTFRLSLTPGSPVSVLEEDCVMVVREL